MSSQNGNHQEEGRVPDHDAVQHCTTAYTTNIPYSPSAPNTPYARYPSYIPEEQAYKKKEPRDVILAFRITRSLADRIDTHKNQYHKRDRTEAVVGLIETAVFIVEKAQNLDDPAIVKYFRDNLYNVQMVDDIMDWPQDRIEAILGVLASERERRFRLRLGRGGNSSNSSSSSSSSRFY